MKKEMFVDVETSGLDNQKDRIVQLAYIYRENGVVKKKSDIKKNIYKTFLGELDTLVNRFDPNDKIYFIAYNASFDSDFIRAMFERNNNKFYGSYFYNPYIDIMQIAARWYMKKDKRPANFKLGTVCKDFGIKVDDTKLHDGLYDITISKALYSKLIKH